MKNQKIEIAYDEQGFIMANQRVNEKREAFVKMVNTAKKFIGIPNDKLKQFRAEPLAYFEHELMQTYENLNPMKLSFKKLTDLLDLNVKEFIDSVNEYQKLKVDELAEVEREQFVKYATTPEQINKYNELKNICDMLNKLKETICPNMAMGTILSAFSGALLLDTSFTKLRPNPYFILG
jgi:hypothetical protein